MSCQHLQACLMPFCCVYLCAASCSQWNLDGAFHVLLPLIHFKGILKASLPSTDENLSCSSGIEVQCFHIIKWDLVLLMGKTKLCMCVDKLAGRLGQIWLRRLILLDFGLDVGVFLLTLVLAVNFKKFIRQGSILCLPSVRGFLKRGKSDTNAKLIDL